ncbi:MAG: MotA/TolQ/ExbB proton channel family protein [Planctomycetota bacterium]|nr:MotA/TolQ/ExbB proton channel family protein [Planctomycetota bacterium]
MDKASAIGFVLALGILALVCFKASHGNLGMFYSEKGLYMVVGGCIAVIFMGLPMDKIKCIPGYCKSFMFSKGMSTVEVIKLMSTLSEKARRDGILSLESEMSKVNEPFLTAGLKMAIDGVDPENIESVLRLELVAMADRHKAGKKFFDLIKVYAPGWGLVATLIGQVGMFAFLGGSIEVMGHMLAVAVVATMYGALLANCIAGPMGDKLGLRSGQEVLNKEMMLQGILSIQNGDNPRTTMDKMMAFIPQSSRATLKLAA